ncbi:hypothetical protein KCU81_g6227, partial [Aureobasidium melanogenum]
MGFKRKRVTCLYNVQQFSDIIVKFNDRKVFAHKAILATSSSYFHRAFTSGFAVSSSPEIDLGDDDDPDLVEAMLRIMYDDQDSCVMTVTFRYTDFFEALLDLYILGDKYDVPVLRHQTKDLLMSNIKSIVYIRDEKRVPVDETFEQAEKCIAKMLGPSAITFADRSIQEEALDWCAENLDDLLWRRPFRKQLGRGKMFSTEFAGRLFLRKARLNAVGFESDHDNDVYDHSSELSEHDEDNVNDDGGGNGHSDDDHDDNEDDSESASEEAGEAGEADDPVQNPSLPEVN